MRRHRAPIFSDTPMPNPKENAMNANVTTFPQTDLGSAAASVVANLAQARPIQWPPKLLNPDAPAPKITTRLFVSI